MNVALLKHFPPSLVDQNCGREVRGLQTSEHILLSHGLYHSKLCIKWSTLKIAKILSSPHAFTAFHAL